MRFGWDTWTSERPAELTHLGTGLRLTPVLYSDRAGAASEVPPGDQIRYGPRAMDGGQVAFETSFEDTRLAWLCDREGESLALSWSAEAHGEWGLRYWVCLCLSGPEGTVFTYDRETGLIRTETGPAFEARCETPPLLVTAHDGVEALAAEFAQHGYFYLGSRSTKGGFLALRFNLDEAPRMTLNVNAPFTPKPRRAEASPLQAIHDVLAWNHVYDPVNARPYTALTRNWSQKKFGGFGVWLNDILFHALLWSMIDPEKAHQNVRAVFAHQTDAGNFPCLVTGNDAWLDRSQYPMASYVVWAIYRASGDEAFLRWAYPKLMANHHWWWQARSLGETGLVAFGTSKGPGDGLYKGTKLAAKNESAMDNMAVHDAAPFNPATGLLQSADVGLNAMLALDGEILGHMAEALGLADPLVETTQRHKAKIRSWLWDAERGVFANRLLDGQFVEALGPTSFFPMVAGVASDAQVAALVDGYLTPEAKFGGPYALPSAPRDQPAYRDNSYWRGRVWGPLNYWVHQGLVRSGRENEARALAEKSRALFDRHWTDRKCGENYSAIDGALNDQPDTDSFYTWGALLPALSVLQTLSDTPWDGVVLNLGRGGLGPIQSPLGVVELNGAEGWSVTLDGRPWMSGNGRVALRQVQLSDTSLSARIATDGPATLRFANTPRSVQLDGADLPVEAQGISLAPGLSGQLAVTFAPTPQGGAQ